MEIETIALKKVRFSKDEEWGVLNPRGQVTNATDLEDSMAEIGQQEPITVRLADDGYYYVISGHRRTVAARNLKWKTIQAIVIRDSITTGEELKHMIASNVRQDIPPVELGRRLARLHASGEPLERLARVAGMTPERAQTYILLTQAPESVQRRVNSGEMAITAFERIQDKPVELQEKIAAQEKVDVRSVKQALKEDRRSGLIIDLAKRLNAEHGLVAMANIFKNEVVAKQNELLESDRTRIAHILHQILDLITSGNGTDG